MSKVQKEISKAVDAHARTLPGGKWVAKLAGKLRYDLVYGPLYLDENGEACSCFENGARQFNFTKAAKIVRDWCDDKLGTMYYDADSGHLTGEKPHEFEECQECEKEGCDYCENGYVESDLSNTYECDATESFLGNELARTI